MWKLNTQYWAQGCKGFCYRHDGQHGGSRKDRGGATKRDRWAPPPTARGTPFFIFIYENLRTSVCSNTYFFPLSQITERLRDPRGIRRGGLSGAGPRNFALNGGRQRGFVRPVFHFLLTHSIKTINSFLFVSFLIHQLIQCVGGEDRPRGSASSKKAALFSCCKGAC